MKSYLSFLLVIFSATTFAQTKDCYPNCTVTFDAVARERIPSITSVEAIGTKCRYEIDKKLKEYRDADLNEFSFLKNKYCAALSGWEQTGPCVHGGPPPCCTAPAATSPWASVGTVKAKAALMAEWHKVQNQRQAEIEKNLFDCLHGLKTEGIDKFNDLYSQASDCLKGIQAHKVVATNNKGLITGYTDQLNSLHLQMQTRAANTTPDPDAIWNVTNQMAKLQVEICGKLAQLNNSIKATPGTVGGVRGEVVKPKIQSVAITNSSPQAQQKATYQQVANNYVNAANNTTDNDIQKAMNLNLAKINATASGNKAQVAQIQQVQNQQMSQNINTLGNQLIALLTKPDAPVYHQMTDEEQWVDINDRVAKDLEEKGYKFDRYQNTINANDTVINNEKQNIDPEQMYGCGRIEYTKYKNYQRALEWFTKAANDGWVEAMTRLGDEYENYFTDEAIKWYEKAAVQPLSEDAQKGKYSRDYSTKNLEKAIVEARQKLRLLCLNGNQANKFRSDYALLLNNYLQRRKNGDKNQLDIGFLYDHGDQTLSKDPEEAMKWYKKAYDENKDMEALTRLANGYGTGVGLAKDPVMAMKLYQQVYDADNQNVEVMEKIALGYETGNGVEKNNIQAIELYQKIVLLSKDDKQRRNRAKDSIKRCKKEIK